MKKKIVIGIVIIGIIIVSGVIITFGLKNNKKMAEKPEDILIRYMSYINNKNYTEMYNLLSEEAKQKISQEDFIKRNSNIYKGIDAANITIEINGIDAVDENNANVRYKTQMDTIAGKLEFNSSTTLTNKDGKYYINWNSSIIYPSLGDSDKIKVITKESKRGVVYYKK